MSETAFSVCAANLQAGSRIYPPLGENVIKTKRTRTEVLGLFAPEVKLNC